MVVRALVAAATDAQGTRQGRLGIVQTWSQSADAWSARPEAEDLP